MTPLLQVTFDCSDVPAESGFWCAALGYELEPPPPGFDTWDDFCRANDIPEDM